jgi:hypothetical protein
MRVHKNGCSPIHWREVSQDDIKKLKEKSHKQHTKDALTAAVEHYLNCNCNCKDKVMEEK